MEKKNILVIRLSAMGDVVMTVPIVAQVIHDYDVSVTIITKKGFSPLFSELKDVQVLSPDFDGKHKNIFGIWKLFRELRKLKKWDAVVDLHNVLRTKLLRFFFRMSGVKVVVINKNRADKRALTQRTGKVLKQLPFVQDEYADAFKKAGFPIVANPYYIFSKSDELPGEIVKISGHKTSRWIGIAPFAKHSPKIYPLEKMEKVIEHFSLKGDVKIFLFGGGKYESGILSGWENKYAHVISMAGKVSLENELRFMAHLDCMLSMDSANMHLANLVNVPVVSVWGATHPYAGFLSKGNPLNKQIQLNLDCRPCSVYGNKPCYKGTDECMTNIKPSKIIESIEQIINS